MTKFSYRLLAGFIRRGNSSPGIGRVVGPVKVVSVSPAPQAAPADEPATDSKSIYGAAALTDDGRSSGAGV